MKPVSRFFVRLYLLLVFLQLPALSALELQPGTTVDFASVSEGQEVLQTSDGYTQAMNALDRAIRMRTNLARTESDFLAHAAAQVRAWTAGETNQLTALFLEFRAELGRFQLPFPGRILLIKTTGLEEMDGAYVRQGRAVVLPSSYLVLPIATLKHVLVHELFHVFSAHNPALRPKLYGILGYVEDKSFTVPTNLLAKTLTNQDSYDNGWRVQVEDVNGVFDAFPLIVSLHTNYTGATSFLDYAEPWLFELRREDDGFVPALTPAGELQPLPLTTVRVTHVSDVGYPVYRGYQPEEILADVLPFLVYGSSRGGSSPRIAHLLAQTLTNAAPPQALTAGIFRHTLLLPQAGGAFDLAASTSLTNWTPINRVLPGSNVVRVVDREAWLAPRRFYRLQPEPPFAPAPGDTNNMVWIEPGEFVMGGVGDPVYGGRFGPLTRVTLTRGFWMAKYPVTQSEYQSVMGVFGNYPGDEFTSGSPPSPRAPAHWFLWRDATNYCHRLTTIALTNGTLPAGMVYRLPTQAEWEYACRAGTTNRWFWTDSSSPLDTIGYSYQYSRDDAGASASLVLPPVGLQLPNPWGLYDLFGSVQELCSDFWADALPGGNVTDYQGPPAGTLRVLRGRGGVFSAAYLRNPAHPDFDMGFAIRLVLGQP